MGGLEKGESMGSYCGDGGGWTAGCCWWSPSVRLPLRGKKRHGLLSVSGLLLAARGKR